LWCGFCHEQLIANSSDRGLCGGINSGVAKAVRLKSNDLTNEGEEVSISLVGDKARGQVCTIAIPSLVDYV